MDILAFYGEQSTLTDLNRISQNEIDMENDSLKKGMANRINSSISRQEQYENMILAWTNYWNITMQKQYGNNYSPIRADVVKAMIVVESNMGEENNEDTIISNGQRDIKQSLDPRNPVFWIVAGVPGNGRTIEVQYAEDDVKRLNLSEKSKTCVLNMSDGGQGDRDFFGNGTWLVVKDIISDDYSKYYADKVTPELSLAIGVGCYCRQLNGAGQNGGISIMRDEYTAVYNYNYEGDPNYIDKVNIVLENMGVSKIEKKIK